MPSYVGSYANYATAELNGQVYLFGGQGITDNKGSVIRFHPDGVVDVVAEDVEQLRGLIHATAVAVDGALYIYGGWPVGDDTTFYDRVLKSEDNGVTWTSVCASATRASRSYSKLMAETNAITGEVTLWLVFANGAVFYSRDLGVIWSRRAQAPVADWSTLAPVQAAMKGRMIYAEDFNHYTLVGEARYYQIWQLETRAEIEIIEITPPEPDFSGNLLAVRTGQGLRMGAMREKADIHPIAMRTS